MKVKFTEHYTVKAADGQTYKKGEIVDMNEASAMHYINRGAAVAHVEEKKPEKKEEPKAVETEKPKGDGKFKAAQKDYRKKALKA